MDYYPINLDLKERPCLVVGGGKVAVRKVEALQKAGAKVTVIAPEIDSAIKDALCHKRSFQAEDLDNQFLAVVATSNRSLNSEISQMARQKKILVNVVDDKELSDFIVPSIVDRDPLLISISTSGHAPYLSKQIRKNLEKEFGDEYSKLLNLLRSYRTRLTALSIEAKEDIWKHLFSNETLKKISMEGIEPIEEWLEEVVDV